MSMEKENLLEELKVMIGIKPHPNVLNLLGCCSTPGNTKKHCTSTMHPDMHVYVWIYM